MIEGMDFLKMCGLVAWHSFMVLVTAAWILFGSALWVLSFGRVAWVPRWMA